MSLPLLRTKLDIPQAREPSVARPHLHARLNDRLERKLTLVSAPAGFGKTTLLSAWVRELGHPVVWLSLDAGDNDPARFFAHLIAALQQVSPAVGRETGAGTGQAPEFAVAALINDISALSSRFTLVLDDYHVIEEEAIHEALRELVTHQPSGMHLVIATREDPPWPLAGLRARGDLVELRGEDLRFGSGETLDYLNRVMGLSLHADDVRNLDSRVEGWVAGLQLAALSMKNRANPREFISSLSGSDHYIFGYLTEEVLARQPAELRLFLLETSVLGRLTGSLCDAVTGRDDGASLLDRLHSMNLFIVPLDSEHQWYRYHYLFSDLLRAQLRRTRPEAVPHLHARASAWFEGNGDPAEAIEHALAADDYPRVVRLLEAHARGVVGQGYVQTVERWLDALPPAWEDVGPRSNLAFAGSLLLRGQLDRVEAYCRNAEAAAAKEGRQGDDRASETAAVLAEVGAIRAILVSLQGDPERGSEMARRAVEMAPPGDTYAQGAACFGLATTYNYAGRLTLAVEAYRRALPLCRASGNLVPWMLAVSNLGLLHVVNGELRSAATLCQEVIGEAERADTVGLPVLGTAHGFYGEVLCQWNELDVAAEEAATALELGRRSGHVAALAYGNVVLSRVCQARGEPDGAGRALGEARSLLRHGMPAWVALAVMAREVAQALLEGDEDAAARVLAGTGVRFEDEATYPRETAHIAHLRLLLHRGRRHAGEVACLDRAIGLAGRLLASAEPAGRMGRVIEVLALRAVANQSRGRLEEALADLEKGLALAEPQGYVRVFVDEGLPMAELLGVLNKRGTKPEYVGRLLAAFPEKAGRESSGLAEPLTDRELEVLALVAKGLSYLEIAERLVISLNTVRFHVKSIYGKLSSHNRTVAIERAKSLGLL